MKNTNEKAISSLKKISNIELSDILTKFGKNIPVNIFTRSVVENKIISELDNYTDEEIVNFIDKYL